MKKHIVVIIFILMSCAPWVKVTGEFKNLNSNYRVNLPYGWMRLNTNKLLLITKDGVLLQNITIERFDISKPLGNTNQKLNMKMLPIETSEAIIRNISADKSVMNFQVIENIPVNIEAKDGFKVMFTYKSKDGLKFKCIYCGFVSNRYLYSIRYTASDRHYFHRDVGEYEKVLNSFKLL